MTLTPLVLLGPLHPWPYLGPYTYTPGPTWAPTSLVLLGPIHPWSYLGPYIHLYPWPYLGPYTYIPGPTWSPTLTSLVLLGPIHPWSYLGPYTYTPGRTWFLWVIPLNNGFVGDTPVFSHLLFHLSTFNTQFLPCSWFFTGLYG